MERKLNLGEKFVWRVGSIEGIDAQKRFCIAKLAVEKTQTDIIELRKYLAVVKDEKVSMEERTSR
jgi:hypothetical protein